MKILVVSLKGGVGKSSIALSIADLYGYTYVTNDLITSNNTNAIQVSPNRKRIPKEHLQIEDVVFDFGAMSTQIDPKVAQAVNHCDIIIVPTLTDQRSLQATLSTVKLVEGKEKPVVIIINNFTKKKKYQEACDYLEANINNPLIFSIRTTTLFERVAKDGRQWLERVKHIKGEYQLKKTLAKHQEVYDQISQLVV